MEYDKNRQGRKGSLRLTVWVQFALAAIATLYILIITNDNYVSGDLYSPIEVFKRGKRGDVADHVYFALHAVFYIYQIGLAYKFLTGDYCEDRTDSQSRD